jgi:hypothetical protein
MSDYWLIGSAAVANGCSHVDLGPFYDHVSQLALSKHARVKFPAL